MSDYGDETNIGGEGKREWSQQEPFLPIEIDVDAATAACVNEDILRMPVAESNNVTNG